MRADENPELSQASYDFIEAVWASDLSGETEVEIGVPQLAQFACGFSEGPERAQMLQALVGSAELRERLISLRETADRLAQQPLASIQAESEEEAIIGDMLRSRSAELARAASIGESEGTQEIRGRLWEGILQAIQETARLIQTQPSFASVRGGPPSQPQPIAPGVIARIRPASAAELSVTLEGDLGGLLGQRLHIMLRDQAGGAVALASTPVSGPDMSVPLRVGEGVLPTSDLFATLDPSLSSQSAWYVPTALGNTERHVPLEVRGPVRIENAVLEVDLAIPSDIRHEFGASELEIALLLGGTKQLLGKWDLASWKAEWRSLSIVIPGAPDGELAWISNLRGHIR